MLGLLLYIFVYHVKSLFDLPDLVDDVLSLEIGLNVSLMTGNAWILRVKLINYKYLRVDLRLFLLPIAEGLASLKTDSPLEKVLVHELVELRHDLVALE